MLQNRSLQPDKLCDMLKFNLKSSMLTKTNPQIQKTKGKY